MKLILASNSPRRKEILEQVGLTFEVVPSKFEEIFTKLNPADLAQNFAYNKALDVYEGYKNNGEEKAIIIGSDTVVYCPCHSFGDDEAVLGKPTDPEDAFRMLKLLSGRRHYVITGVSIIDSTTGNSLTNFEKTSVKMRALSDPEIWSYIATKEPFDKAGSYAIQGIGSLFIEEIQGDYFNVVGLPIFRLSKMLKEFGFNIL